MQRELFYNKDVKVLGGNAFRIATDSLEEIYNYNEKFHNDHYNNRGDLNSEYVALLDRFFMEDLCNQTKIIKYNLIPFECDTYPYAQLVSIYFNILQINHF